VADWSGAVVCLLAAPLIQLFIINVGSVWLHNALGINLLLLGSDTPIATDVTVIVVCMSVYASVTFMHPAKAV